MVEAEWVACPLCFMNRKLNKSGTYAYQKKGIETSGKPASTSSFGKFNFNKDSFILMRNCPGGRGGVGFPLIHSKCLTLSQAVSIPQYAELITQIDEFVKKWGKFRKGK